LADRPQVAILPAKLTVPDLPEPHLARPRLWSLLRAPARLVTVSGAAGSGKTVAVSEWLRSAEAPSCGWLSLDERDNDPARFWRHVSAAISGLAPGSGAAARDAAARVEGIGSGPGPSDEWYRATLDALVAVGRRAVVIFDNLHLITNASVLNDLRYLVTLAPANATLVMVTRSNPPIGLHSFRIRGEVAEIGQQELAFSPDEVTAYLRSCPGPEMRAEDRERLVGYTDGWAAAIRMAARSREVRSGQLTALRPLVADLLTAEVLESQPAATRAFLQDSVLLPQLNGTLCDAITGSSDGKQLIERLTRDNLFLVPVGAEGWFRYQPLFAEVVRARVAAQEPERSSSVRAEAARWLEADGRVDAALALLTDAGAERLAFELVQRNAPGLIDDGQVSAVRAWLDQFSDGFLAGDDERLLGAVELLRSAGSYDRAYRLLVSARAYAGQNAFEVQSLMVDTGRPRAALEVASDGLGAIDPAVRAQLARAWAQVERPAQGLRLLQRSAGRPVDQFTQDHVIPGVAGYLNWSEGNLRRAEEQLDQAFNHPDHPDSPRLLPAQVARAGIDLEHGDVDGAQLALTRLLKAPVLPLDLAVVTSIELAKSWVALHRLDRAAQSLEAARAFTRSSRRLRHRLGAAMAWLEIEAGTPGRAATVLATLPPGYRRSVLECRLALAHGQRETVAGILDRLDASTRTTGQSVVVAALRARAALVFGLPGASDAVERLATLTGQEGFSLTVHREGPELRRAINSLPGRLPWEVHHAPRAPSGDAATFPLSEREHQVLRLLAGPLPAIELCNELTISPNTLKSHRSAIYRKLGVTSRMAAVVEARRLGLLPEPGGYRAVAG
jgi:LuxR family maltose regulon positive regulatory protein